MTVLPAGLISAPPTRVLFLCESHAALSRMAEAFARLVAPGDSLVWSAGLHPRPLDPLAAEVMREIGIELERTPGRGVSALPWREADSVVLVGATARRACPPVARDVRRIHWPLPDPDPGPPERKLARYRAARDDLRWRVSSLWAAFARGQSP